MNSQGQDKIIVLGKEFPSEEERRAYFREELRKKLPELKKMEGFPIGEDEDILNLSDPPYYTACPNPWLNDFIAEWESEKKELEKKGLRKADFEVAEPYAADVSEGKNNPFYNAHSYHTKVPHPAIMRYILHYTQPGDIVFDGFAGTGMTGVASSQCQNPTDEVKYQIEKDFKTSSISNPNWGRRHAILGELSPAASFISYNYNSKINLNEYQATIEKILSKIDLELGWMYVTNHSDGTKGKINFTVWSDVFLCSYCGEEIVFFEEATDKETGKLLEEFKCPKCNAIHKKRNLEKAKVSIYDRILDQVILQSKKVPVLINYTVNEKRFEKKPDKDDFLLLNKISDIQIDFWFPTYRLPDGDESRRNDDDGFTHTHHFYNKRSLILLSTLYSYCEGDPLKSKLWFLFEQWVIGLSLLNRYSPTHYSQNNRNLSGTLYIGSQLAEVSPYYAFEKKIKNLYKVFNSIKENNLIGIQSASNLQLNDSCIDYIFTDPPFGSNIMYSELNFLWESWLKVKTNIKEEAIENKTQKKTIFDYQAIMTDCFKEMFRVLKPGKWMTVEFSNTSAAVWNGIQTAIQRAGFVIANVAGLDKQQGSFKAVTTPTAVKQDLVISCYKPSIEFENEFIQHKNSALGFWEFVTEHLDHLPIHMASGNSTTTIIERSPKILFDRLIAFYVQRGLPVPIDAGKFQQGLRERFIERDGMFFTHEQVQEYDRKKAEVPNFIQMSIFVGNEQDAIYWLRNLLEKASKTEQDLHPLWMKEVAGNMRKGDSLPEMRTILEENFLKNEKGQWYLPDPENEADLEKLRTKRLLKQFDLIKTEAYKPKTKIKEARVEALRAGFKQCYQDKDFQTIVQVGDRIPNNLLMEDEVLLQFYDIASSRV
ncbi:DNA methyltransferase [Algoriphagus sp. AK58]|uniref:DNA methyltransferase n=1 Tax=Algoriphagus sp. AK58 TaxID=1406877 RepID=UPI0016504560|nr:DNA methyltransferase [Algoriphagus sp. AK58]MBC6368018.1 DNA methylase [Algoriphagus sp. AK58]